MFTFFRYKVSNFGYDLLQKISNDPLFNLQDLSPSLFKKAKVLSQIRVSVFVIVSTSLILGTGVVVRVYLIWLRKRYS